LSPGKAGFFTRQVFQKHPKNGQILKNWFQIQNSNWCFWRFTVPKKRHFPISECFETNNFVIKAQKLRTGRRFVSFGLFETSFSKFVRFWDVFEKPAA